MASWVFMFMPWRASQLFVASSESDIMESVPNALGDNLNILAYEAFSVG